MKTLVTLVLVLMLGSAFAQPGQGRMRGQAGPQPGYHPRYQPGPPPGYQPGPYQQREFQRQMPPPERRMGWEERQQLREQVRGGQMSRDEARERWREERARRSPEERQRLRRDVLEVDRDLGRR